MQAYKKLEFSSKIDFNQFCSPLFMLTLVQVLDVVVDGSNMKCNMY